MKRLVLIFVLIPAFVFAQDWWTKTKRECIPEDLTATKLLVEKFKTKKPDDAPIQAFLDKEKHDDHPLIKKTNDDLDTYNEELKEIFKNYKYDYSVVSEKKGEDLEKYPVTEAAYILKHEVYLRKYQKEGMTRHYYTYLFYFHDRENNRDFPYIYLFEEQRLESLKKLIGYLNTL